MPTSSSPSDPVEALQKEIARLKDVVLDREDTLHRLEQQNEVLESFCFAVEKDHDLAARRLNAAEAELKATLDGVRRLKAEQDDILANVKQGILTLDKDLLINAGYSRITEQMFERTDLVGVPFEELFDDLELRARVRRFLETCLQSRHASPEMLERLNPLREHSHTVARAGTVKLFSFSFARVLRRELEATEPGASTATAIEKLMVVIDDRTAEYELNRELAKRTREHAAEVEKAYQLVMLPPDVVTNFMAEARDAVAEIEVLHRARSSGQADALSLRIAHSVKGNARALGLDTIATATHALEDVLAGGDARDVGEALARIRDELDNGQQLFERLLGVRAALSSTATDRASSIEITLRNLVQQEAPHVGKSVALRYVSALSNGLPPDLAFRIKSSLVQLLRNAIAHGIETPAERTRSQKPETGNVDIRIDQVGESIVVVCRDDGRGIDVEKLRAAAVERGVITLDDARQLEGEQVQRLMFKTGVSTQQHVSELAGRGVGLDVVRDHVEAVGGTLGVTSAPASHTEFVLTFPAHGFSAAADRTSA